MEKRKPKSPMIPVKSLEDWEPDGKLKRALDAILGVDESDEKGGKDVHAGSPRPGAG
jgi:hypothetical protein